MDQVFQISDLVLKILAFIPDGATYKATTLVCQQWHTICAGEFRWMIAAYSNHLMTLIKMFPDKNWNWQTVASNPNLPLGEITGYDKAQWDYEEVIYNPNMTWECIKNNLSRFGYWYDEF